MRFTLRDLAVLIFVAGCLFAFAQLVRKANRAAERSVCDGHLAQIAHALLEYREVHGHLPPAYVADADGKPMHSWRVLLLPFLNYEDIYARYNLNEAWNGPNNSKLLQEIPNEYKCASTNASDGRTPFLALKSAVSNVELGVGEVLIVEDAVHSVNWMEPTDVLESAVEQALKRPSELSHHGGGLGVVNAKCRYERRNSLHVPRD
jgi:hypothetical protein